MFLKAAIVTLMAVRAATAAATDITAGGLHSREALLRSVEELELEWTGRIFKDDAEETTLYGDAEVPIAADP